MNEYPAPTAHTTDHSLWCGCVWRHMLDMSRDCMLICHRSAVMWPVIITGNTSFDVVDVVVVDHDDNFVWKLGHRKKSSLLSWVRMIWWPKVIKAVTSSRAIDDDCFIDLDWQCTKIMIRMKHGDDEKMVICGRYGRRWWRTDHISSWMTSSMTRTRYSESW